MADPRPEQASSKVLSVRLDSQDHQRLRDISERVNELVTHKNVKDSTIIRALLIEAKEMEPERLVQRIKELV
jgi:hypothetical protein